MHKHERSADYARMAPGRKAPAILKILSWSGRSIDDVSAFPCQDELLIPPGRKFMFIAKRVVRILRNKVDAEGRPVLRDKMVKDPSGGWVAEQRLNRATGQLENVKSARP